MTVGSLLKKMSQTVVSCRPEDTIETIATILSAKHIGAMPVRNAEGAMVGIVSERDIVRALSEHGAKVGELRVRDIMTEDVVSCGPDDTIDHARGLLHKHGFRHLPVLENGQIKGFLSIRDLLESRLAETELEVNVLKDSVIAARFG